MPDRHSTTIAEAARLAAEGERDEDRPSRRELADEGCFECGRGVVYLGGGRWSAYCREHLLPGPA